MAGGCGPTRNLTPLFLKFRAARKNKSNRFASVLGTSTTTTPSISRSDDEAPDIFLSDFSLSMHSLQGREGLLSRAPLSPPDVGLPPVWVDLIEEANDDISKAKEKLSSLQKVQQQRLIKIFGDEDSLQRPERDVEALSVQITEILRKCERKIRQLGVPAESSSSDSEVKLRQNAQRNIATQLQSLSKQMRFQQQHYVSELRKRHQLDNDTSETSTRPASYDEAELISNQQVMDQLEDLEHTSDEIVRIAQSMAELNGIFKDLNMIVIDQGTILDRIDYNIEQVVEQTGNATRHIHKAEQHQRSGRAGRVILFLITMIVLLVCQILRCHLMLLAC